MLGVPHIQIDPGHVRQIAGVLVALKKEMMAIVEVLIRPTGTLQKIYVGILVRFGTDSGAQFTKRGDYAGGIFQGELFAHQHFQFERASNDAVWRPFALIGVGNRIYDRSNAALGEG
jgi:hypothetical protein